MIISREDYNSLIGKRVLVTGPSGFIAKHLLAQLEKLPIDLHTLSKDRMFDKEDLCADILIHLGAYTPKDRIGGTHHDIIYKYNILATEYLLSRFYNPPAKIIFSSTLDVYEPTSTPITEESKINPISIYGSSKLFCEHIVSLWAAKSGIQSNILRYGNVYGSGEERYKKLIPCVISNIKRGIQPTIVGDPNIKRDFIHVSDVVGATIKSMISSTSHTPINIVSGSSKTVQEYVETICTITGWTAGINYISGSPDHSREFDNTRMKDILNVSEFIDIKTGLTEEVMNWNNDVA